MDITIKNGDSEIKLMNGEEISIVIDQIELGTTTNDIGSVIRRNGSYLGYKQEVSGNEPPQVLYGLSKRKELFGAIESVIENFKKTLPEGVHIWINATQPEEFLSVSVDLGKTYA